MTINNDDLLGSILESLDRIRFIEPEDIPGIDLYMDQVTSFMDRRLKSTMRNPSDGRILTKTMINNYAKNDLIPPPIKKKYSKEHMILLIFIYYYKGILSISDIQKLLRPITEKYFDCGREFDLESVYQEVLSIEKSQIDGFKKDVIEKFNEAQETFGDAPESGKEFLQKFAFICMLSYDVYVKKLMIEKMIDEMMNPSCSDGMKKKTVKKEAEKKEAEKKEAEKKRKEVKKE